MKNKIKSILSILFVGFALILSFSCNMGIIEIEQKEEAYLSIGMEENARMVTPSLKKELITDIKLYKNSEAEPLGVWDNYDSMKDAKIPMAIGEYELKLEAKLGSLSLEDTKNVNIIKGENSVKFTPSLPISSSQEGEGTGDVKITLSYEGNGDVSQGIFQIRDIWNENYRYGQLESSSNGKLVFKATDLPCKNYYFTVQAKVGDKWATYSDLMVIIPDMTSEGEFTCKLTDAPVLPSTKVTIMNGSNKVTEKDLCANASFYNIFKSIITTEEINNLTEEGKIFYGFKDENGTEVNFVPEEDCTLYINWREAKTVTFNTNGGSYIEPGKVPSGISMTIIEPDWSKGEFYFNHGYSCEKYISKPTKAGYIFDGWFLDEGLTKPASCSDWSKYYDVTGDFTVYAKWAEADTISFETNGGNDISEIIVTKGSTISINIYNTAIYLLGKWINKPTKENYEFDGWYLDSSFTTPLVDGYTTNESVTLYAKWATPCKIYFNVNGGDDIEIDPIEVVSGDSGFFMPNYNRFVFNSKKVGWIQRDNPTRDGYCLGGWTNQDGSITYDNLDSILEVNNDVTVYAKWVKPCTITFVTNCEQTIDPVVVPSGNKVCFIHVSEDIYFYVYADNGQGGYANLATVTLPENGSSVFEGWYRDEAFTETMMGSEGYTEITSDITVYAKWE